MRLHVIVEFFENKLKFIERLFDQLKEDDKKYIQRLMLKLYVHDLKSLAEKLKDMDPTAERAEYLVWIFKTIIKDGNIRLPEDGTRIYMALDRFSKAKKLRSYDDEKDIGKIRSLRDLESIVSKYIIDTPITSLRSWDHYVNESRARCMKLLYSDKNYKYYAISSINEKYESIPYRQPGGYTSVIPKQIASPQQIQNASYTTTVDIAAYVLADIAKRSTTWCVAEPSTADGYLLKSPMYLMYKDDEPYFLAKNNYSEVMSGGGQQTPLSENISYPLLVAFAKILLNNQIQADISKSSSKAMQSRIENGLDRLENDDRLEEGVKGRLKQLFTKALGKNDTTDEEDYETRLDS